MLHGCSLARISPAEHSLQWTTPEAVTRIDDLACCSYALALNVTMFYFALSSMPGKTRASGRTKEYSLSFAYISAVPVAEVVVALVVLALLLVLLVVGRFCGSGLWQHLQQRQQEPPYSHVECCSASALFTTPLTGSVAVTRAFAAYAPACFCVPTGPCWGCFAQ